MQAFPKTGVKEQISNGGGVQPRWGRDCTEIFYIDPEGKLMVASIEASGEGVKVGESVSLFQTKIALGGYMDIMRAQYDVSRDGRRFLINNTVGDPSPSPITIVTNWTSLLKK